MKWKIQKSDELYHYGIKGQKWGVRRYQNLDGSLTAAGRVRYLSESGDKIYNLDKWQKDPDHNLLIITGLSGSGKSTIARKLNESRTATWIQLDAVCDNPTVSGAISDDFLHYIFKKAPEYKKIYKNFEKYDNVRFTDPSNKLAKEYWHCMDKVPRICEQYARDRYSDGISVVAEGIQFLDTTMFTDQKSRNQYIQDKPIIIKGTPIRESTLRRVEREYGKVDDPEKYIEDQLPSMQNQWQEGIDSIDKHMIKTGAQLLYKKTSLH